MVQGAFKQFGYYGKNINMHITAGNGKGAKVMEARGKQDCEFKP
jgi:hypothetical protein